MISPDLRVTKSHSGNFTVGVNGVYTITVDNTLGTAPTAGTITVTDTLKNIGKGLGSASPESGYSWYAGI